MSAMDHPTMLTRLIIAGELAMQMRCDHDSGQRQADLMTAVNAAYQKPADDVRVIDSDVVLFCMALTAATQKLLSHRREDAAKYLRVLGVLMPEIRAALTLAIEQRKRPTA